MKKNFIFLLLSIIFSLNIRAEVELNDKIDLKLIKGFHIIKDDDKRIKLSDIGEKLYVETNEQDRLIRFFLQLKNNALQEIQAFKNSNDLEDTHLKSSFSEIKLSIPFSKIKEIPDTEIIGYAPIGSYKDGWTGIRMFFEGNSVGICSYSLEKFLGINADSSKIYYLINKKPSFVSIEGSYNLGFLYVLSWDDDKKTSVYDHKLECVNKNLNRNIMSKMIDLAIKIDKS